MDYALEIQDLQKVYPSFTLNHINLRVPKGSIMGLIGENGAGKSTTIKALLGLIKIDSGSIKVMGKPFSDGNIELKEQIGVVFDTLSFPPHLTAAKIGEIGKQAYKQWDQKKYDAYLEQFGIDRRKKIKDLSRGMEVKLSLSVALSHNPKVLVLDEATSGLDPVVRDDILELFLEFVQDEDHAILISSHITSDLEKIADYITFIHKGNIKLSQEKDELLYQYGIIRCRESEFSNIDKEDVEAYRKEGYQYNILVKDKKKAQAKYPDMVVDATSLDEIMLLYVKGESK